MPVPAGMEQKIMHMALQFGENELMTPIIRRRHPNR
jgi:hypothetical protein